MRRVSVVAVMISAAMATACSSGDDAKLTAANLHEQVVDCDVAWLGVDTCAKACEVRPEDKSPDAKCGDQRHRPCSDPANACAGATSPDEQPHDCKSTFVTSTGARGCCVELTAYDDDYRVATFFECPAP